MALGTALMLLCWCLGRCSMVRVKVSNPLSWSVFCGCGGICGFDRLEPRPCWHGKNQAPSVGRLRSQAHRAGARFSRTFGRLSGLSLGSRLWLNFGLSNMRVKGLAEVVKGLGAKRL